MELKLVQWQWKEDLFKHLLIVPYGIETLHSRLSERGKSLLLIVPYGIETKKGVVESACKYTF